MENAHDKPKKCGTVDGFVKGCLTNEDKTKYYMGDTILRLWQKCDGNRTLDDLVGLMSEESEENAGTKCTPELINEMLDLLKARKLIT